MKQFMELHFKYGEKKYVDGVKSIDETSAFMVNVENLASIRPSFSPNNEPRGSVIFQINGGSGITVMESYKWLCEQLTGSFNPDKQLTPRYDV